MLRSGLCKCRVVDVIVKFNRSTEPGIARIPSNRACLAADSLSKFAVLFDGCLHHCEVRIVFVELAVFIGRRLTKSVAPPSFNPGAESRTVI
jgi:hypothetical protein